MKIYSLAPLLASASAGTVDFKWAPQNNKCDVSTGWAAHYGTKQNPRGNKGSMKPTFHTDVDIPFCSFDGNNDYVALDKKFSGTTSKFTVEVSFRTSFKSNGNWDNWSFLDCDRSEHFNVFVTGKGKLGFSTAGTGHIQDMFSLTDDLNDDNWHTATFTYNNGVKSMYIDGIFDSKVNDNGRTKIGQGRQSRYCFIGDGSEASTFDKLARNYLHYQGDLAKVTYTSDYVPPTEPTFSWYAKEGKCADKQGYGWPVYVGKNHANAAPTQKLENGVSYCHFDGNNDYLAIDTKHFEGSTEAFRVKAVFRTDMKSNKNWYDNWAFLDCDRSEHFNVVVDAKDGKIVFSTAGTGNIHDMFSSKAGLNDNKWHEVEVLYDHGTKKIFIDGELDSTANDNGRTKIGQNRQRRFCFIGDGSEANQFDNGSRNRIYYKGDLALVQYQEGTGAFSSEEPYECNAYWCGEWDCNTWCRCFEEANEGLYVANHCDDDDGSPCDCGMA